jgi:cysteine synthase A
LNSITKGLEAKVLVKLEYLNPSGSLKDRIALRMIEEAEKAGKIKPGYTIVDGSTGNTGIALSFVGTMKGYKVVIFMPEGVSEERTKIMHRYGAEVVTVNAQEEEQLKERGKSIYGAEVEVPLRIKSLEEEKKNPKVWWARQFANHGNVLAHNDTGREILKQVGGKVDVFVASIGTGGTLMGVGQVLKKSNPRVRLVAVEPTASHFPLISGYKRIPGASPEITGGIIAEMVDGKMVDDVVQVKGEDAIEMAHRLVKEEGLYAGISAGANVLVAVSEAKKLGKRKNVVTVLPDSMDRYLSSEVYTT